MTTFQWATCACITTYTDDSAATLVRYENKCPFHQRMDNATAFAELKTAHLTKAQAIKAARQGMYGDQRNPEKYGLGPSPVVQFEQTVANLRTVVVVQASVPSNRRTAVTTELAKIVTAHPVVMKVP